MLPGLRVAATAAALVLCFGAGHPARIRVTGATLRHHSPARIREHRTAGTTSSYNWSGYALTTANGAVTSVTGSWIVPTASCSSALGDASGYAAFWVGIDGYSSNTVEQTGTDSDCVSTNGKVRDTPTYYAWFEFYPGGSYIIEFPGGISPGDHMTATVSYVGEVTSNPRRGHGGSTSSPEFTITIEDLSKGESYSTTAVVSGAAQSSAEWIAEAPCCENNGDVLPLADFGTVSFSSSTATVSGSSVTPTSGMTNLEEITMNGELTPSIVKASPSAMTNGSFTVTWGNAGP